MLRRILLIAKRDFTAAVMTKAFVIGLVVLPLLMGSGFLGFALLRVTQGETAKRIAIIDHTGHGGCGDHPGGGDQEPPMTKQTRPGRSSWFRRAMCSRKFGPMMPMKHSGSLFQIVCGITN